MPKLVNKYVFANAEREANKIWKIERNKKSLGTTLCISNGGMVLKMKQIEIKQTVVII